MFASEEQWVSSGEYHTVMFEKDGQIVYETRVLDGDTININEIEALQKIEEGIWIFPYSSPEDKFNCYIPILEDCVLIYNPL